MIFSWEILDVLEEIVECRPFLGQQIHNFNKFGSRNPYRSMGHKKMSILAKSELPNPSGRPKNAPNTFAISVDLDRPQPTSDRTRHKPFKSNELGLLTYISRKSASRRFSWCNSQLLFPSGRRDMSESSPRDVETYFKPKTPYFSQSRSVGRNTVSLISRRPEGFRSWELHHENRRVALFPKI